ncbi:MAG: hypothetical protein K1X75_09140 [Leptospirales bacterium]|nr:hypothetical protein [Leptospirales bacterium]
MSLFGRSMRMIERDLDSGQSIELRACLSSRASVRKLERVLTLVLGRYRRPELETCLHYCTTELLNNAIRANMKHIFLLDYDNDLSKEGGYRTALREFKASRRRADWLAYFRRRARQEGLCVRLTIRHEAHGLRIYVRNNAPLLVRDEQRLRQKFAAAMRDSDILEFHRCHGDDQEGEGLGVALNIQFLRSENLDPALLRIGRHGGETVARLEIPLHPDFVSERSSRVVA